MTPHESDSPSEPPSEIPPQKPIQEQALYTGQGLLSALTQQMQQMQQMQTLLTQLMMQSLNSSIAGRTPNPGNRQRRQRATNRYCWTHGACGHTGEECTRAEGHQAAATFHNRMGGSTRNVRNADTLGLEN